MKTPKEYAIELVSNFYRFQPLLSKKEAKFFATITVNKIIESNPLRPINTEFGDAIYYYQEVLKEIQLIN